jgi:uncharacterized protein YkwD
MCVFLLLLLECTGCAEPATPTSAPYPSTLDIVLVHDEVTMLINSIRTSHEVETLAWDEDLQGLAERRAWKIVKGEIPFDEVDDSLANELGEPVAELRACLSADVKTPAAVAEAAVEQWLVEPELREMLLGDWERIGVGFDWGCPKPDARGVVLVVVMVGEAVDTRLASYPRTRMLRQ